MTIRKGSIYWFQPVLGDHKYEHYRDYFVRVINAPGLPNVTIPKWTFVETLTGESIGMVYRNSLVPLTNEQRKMLRRAVAK